MKELEKGLASPDYNFISESQLRMAVFVDFMSIIRRYPTSKLKTVSDLLNIAIYSRLHAPCVKETDIVYDSCLGDSIKECKRIRGRSFYSHLNLETTRSIPVQINPFWACGKNKEAIQEISRDFFKKIRGHKWSLDTNFLRGPIRKPELKLLSCLCSKK